MKIVNIIQRYPPAVGGSETWCQEVCRYLAKRGHDVKVLTLDVNKEEEYWRDPLDDEWTLAFGRLAFDEGVVVRRYHRSIPIHTVYHLLYKTLLDRLFNIYFYGPHSVEMYGKMWREIKNADVVFLHTLPHPHNLVASAVAKLFRKKIVVVPHFHPTHPYYERWVNYWLLRHCEVVITVTAFEKTYLHNKGVASEKIYVTGNAIHLEEYLPRELDAFRSTLERRYGLQPNERVVTFLGRKTPEKGVGHLVAAVKELRAEIPLRLFLAGPGLDWYRDLYASLPYEEKRWIIDMGVISHQEKVNLLHLSDLLVLPSKYEAFGIVFLEAWVCGIPVLGTREGAMPSVIGNEGLLCTFGDVEDLKAKLKDAFADPKALQTMGSRGRTKVCEHYTWDVIGKKAEQAVRAAFGGGKRKMKVVIVTNAYPPHFIGGAELIAHSHAKALKEQGHDVAVFAGEPNDIAERYSMRRDTYEGIPVNRICLHAKDYSADFFNFYHKRVHESFCDFIENISPEVVHFHNIMGLSASLIHAAKRRRIKTILTFHDHWGICFKNTLLKSEGGICKEDTECERCMPFISDQGWEAVPLCMRSDYIALQLDDIDTFICPSTYLTNTYIRAGINEKRMRVVWYGVDVDRFAKITKSEDQTKVRFSFLGYLGRHKGVHTILEALSSLNGNLREKVTVNLVGGGDQINYYEQRVMEFGLEKIVKFWGKIDNNRIEDIYRQTDVLILPSIWPENQPVTITEAMASRIPVIASRTGGTPELVEDGETGYLFERNNPKDLAQKMLEFVFDRSKLIDFGKRAFYKISHNTFHNQVEKIIAIYQEEGESLKTDRLTGEELIVCLGKKIPHQCPQALNIFRSESGRKWRVVLMDWLDEDQIEKAKLLWVVDKDVDPSEVTIGLRNKLPLLVPESNENLKNICIKGKCGLFYGNTMEAVVGLEYLTNNEALRKAMGQNGFKFFYESKL